MTHEFDPLSDLFVAQFAKPPDLGIVNLRALTPFQRALLVIDGTVTKFIEAYTMEPVTVRIISHEQRRLSADNTWLEAEAGTTVLARDVVLEGKYSGVLHAHALSLVLPERLPAEALTQMGAHPGGLGQILLESRIETRREVLWYGREAADGLPAAIRTRMSGGCLSRTYRIITHGRPVSLIHERFPLEPDRIPAQV
ncbi:MAG TPA: chorismate pyruvate-lyase family protein [bacterium]|nr:chorismate pyruvate-lyase family protein [bacterium]